jgi:hypothetical protein
MLGLGLGLPLTPVSLGISGMLRPRLNLNFLEGGLDPRITFTRASSGTHFNNTGLLVAASTNVARFDYDPVTLAPKGLLVEESRTNLALNSAVIAAGPGTTVSPDAAVSPDGTLSADLIRENGITGEHYAGDRFIAVTAGSTYTWSVFVKDAPSANRSLHLRVAVAADITLEFDPRTKTISNPGGTGYLSSEFRELPNGWFRVAMAFTAQTTTTLVCRLQFFTTTSVYTGDGTSGLYLWGAQLEVGAFPTSYIPTVASQATRAADIALMTGTNFSSWYNQSEGTFVSRQSRPLTAIADGNVFQADDGTNNNRLSQGTGSSGNVLNPSIIVGGVAQAVLTQGANTGLGEDSCAVAYKLNDFAASSNGAAAVIDVSGTLPIVNELWIGKSLGAAYWNGHIRFIKYFNKRLPNAQLQSLTL